MEIDVIDGRFANVKWSLSAVVGEEAMNDLFTFHLTMASREEAVMNVSQRELEDGLVGAHVTLSMHEKDSRRHGVVASLELDPRREKANGVVARVVMRPRVWLTTLRKNTRIFQGLYVHEIVNRILTESNVPHRWVLQNNYPKRVYCTQYEETDYDFVKRILAEEGIFWFFEHAGRHSPTFSPRKAPEGSATSTVAKIAGKVLSGAAPVIEDISKSGVATGVFTGGGAISSIVSDTASVYVDPEADDPIEGSTGTGGPRFDTPVEVFVFGDRVDAYITHEDAKVRFVPHTNLFAHDAVLSISSARSVGPKAVEIRDYNFRRPMALLSTQTGVEEVAGARSPLEHYEHHGEYEKPDVDPEQARIRLEQLRASTSIVRGESTCPAMTPGFGLFLSAAPEPFHDGRFVPVRVQHEAYQMGLGTSDASTAEDDEQRVMAAVATLLRDLDGSRRRLAEGELRELARGALAGAATGPKVYNNRFEWVAQDVVFRPPPPKRIRHAVTESAVVVGPAGNAIHVDNYGRVKVQFHWDRESQYNEESSCWVRVLSTWAGAGYGFQFVPRIGMEVVVTFLGGDPDRPVVSGTLYNATHPTPEPLPQRYSRSGFRSQTVPGGGGFNELSFEDQKGVERVFLHAQKDLQEIINDGHTTQVRGAQTTVVGGVRKVGVQGDQIVGVGSNATTIVAKNQASHVGGDRIETVAKSSRELVHGDATREVRGIAMTESVSDDLHVVRGDHGVTVHGRHVLYVQPPKVGGKGSSTTYVDGTTYITATESVVVRASGSPAPPPVDPTKPPPPKEHPTIRLECGDSSIVLDREGITLNAKTIRLVATEKMETLAKASEVAVTDTMTLARAEATFVIGEDGLSVGGAAKIAFKTPKARLVLGEATAEVVASAGIAMKAAQIALSSGSAQDQASTSQATSDATSKKSHLKLKLVHPQGKNEEGIAGARYRVLSDDFVHEGTTAADGTIDVEVPPTLADATVMVFANEVKAYKGRYDSPLVWRVHVRPSFHEPTDLRGARMRLRNLGYSTGVDLEEKDPLKDPLTVKAIEDFQRDHGIRVSGKLDEDETAQKLAEAFGKVS